MNTKISFTGLSVLAHSLALLILTLLCGQSLAANYPLEIIQPQPSLNIANRFYKAYPGIEYNVRLGVIGGSYPFDYELTTSPGGMSINKVTGEITWPSPTESVSPYTVTAKVTDQESTERTVTWTITVTTSGFKFVDSKVGSSGDGSIGSPYKTLSDVYSSAAANDFLYFRAGTYNTIGLSLPGGNNWLVDTHPGIFMGYPGETATIDFSAGTPIGFLHYGPANKIYYDNLTIVPKGGSDPRGIIWVGNQTGVVMRRLTLKGLISGNNSSYLFATNAGTSGKYTVIQDCVVTSASGGYFFLGYSNSHVLVEGNTVSGTTGSAHGISPKSGNNYWFIRNNNIDVAGSGAVYIQGYNNGGNGNGNIVVEYNYLSSDSGNGLSVNDNAYSTFGPIYIVRNTIRGRVWTRSDEPGYAGSPYIFSKNVIINSDSSFTDRVRLGGTSSESNMIYDDNLTGSASANIVDTQGYLTTGFSSYLGSHGFEIGVRSKPPGGIGVD